MSKKILPICKWCGSDTIWADASASWNVETQMWELENVMDWTGCSNCSEANYFEVEDTSDIYPAGTQKAVLVQGFADNLDGRRISMSSAVIEDPETKECFVVWELKEDVFVCEQLPLQSIQVLEKIDEFVWRKYEPTTPDRN